MTVLVYPAALPGPMPGSFDPRPRRAASSIEGPLQQRARQRDAAGMASEYTYVYTPGEMAQWLDWYRNTLREGRRWFAHSLPGRGGVVQRVVRYLGVSQRLVGGGIYRVAARFEQRGASVVPVEPEFSGFIEDFENGLGLYTGSGPWTLDPSPYGENCLHMAGSVFDDTYVFARPIPSMSFNRFEAKVFISGYGASLTGGYLYLRNAGSTVLAFCPKPPTSTDADERPVLQPGASAALSPIGSVKQPLDVWCTVKAAWVGGGVELRIEETESGMLVGSTAIAGPVPTPTADELRFVDYADYMSLGVNWDDIRLYTE